MKIYLLLFVQMLSATVFGQNEQTFQGATDSVISDNPRVLHGIASYYSDKFNGRKTANGEIFDQTKFTAACNKLPFGTRIRVTNEKNGQSVIVRVNDRLHPKMKRVVDLSKAAAKKINIISKGLAKVKVEVLDRKSKK